MALLLVLLLQMQSCVAVKEYDKLYINDRHEIGGQSCGMKLRFKYIVKLQQSKWK
jgi:hypothetical protein